MQVEIVEQVVDFYGTVFEKIFAAPFRTEIAEPLKRKAVVRQISQAEVSLAGLANRWRRHQGRKQTGVFSV